MKGVTLFLLAIMLLPSALQACEIANFCLMEIAEHQDMMASSHDCCTPATSNQPTPDAIQHDCNNGQICACPVELHAEESSFQIPSSHKAAIILPQLGFIFGITSPDEFVYQDVLAVTREGTTPLYLLYDTFLN